MPLRDCSFETERLLVREWHSLPPGDWRPKELEQVVAGLLTDAVTCSLPPSWQGSYTSDRASTWIRERDEEGTTLLVVDKLTKKPVGLMILSDPGAEESRAGIDVRIGYLLSEASWGRGVASELVKGFVNWARAQPFISTVAGGVSADNPASRRVLEKTGFHLVHSSDEGANDEQLFQLRLR